VEHNTLLQRTCGTQYPESRSRHIETHRRSLSGIGGLNVEGNIVAGHLRCLSMPVAVLFSVLSGSHPARLVISRRTPIRTVRGDGNRRVFAGAASCRGAIFTKLLLTASAAARLRSFPARRAITALWWHIRGLGLKDRGHLLSARRRQYHFCTTFAQETRP